MSMRMLMHAMHVRTGKHKTYAVRWNGSMCRQVLIARTVTPTNARRNKIKSLNLYASTLACRIRVAGQHVGPHRLQRGVRLQRE